jgi:ATP-dependent Lon protease
MNEETMSQTSPNEEDNQSSKPRALPDALVILPLRNTVLFPATVAPFTIGRPGSAQAIQEAVRKETPIGIVAQKNAKTELPKPQDLHQIGTIADILRFATSNDGQLQLLVRGRKRFKILDYIQTEPFLIARISVFAETVPETKEFEARMLHLRQEAQRAWSLLPEPIPDLASTLQALNDPSVLVDFVASWLDLPLSEKQEILETIDIEERAQKVAEKLAHHIEVLELTKKIGTEAKDAMDKAQRDYILRQQLKAIQKELGEEEGKGAEIEELKRKIQAAKMPPEVEREALKEVARLERMPDGAAEYSMVRTYLDWMIELPWSAATEEQIDLPKAREVLDADHHDLEKVKKRILELLAIRKLNPKGKSPILCFVGPPGVGKTSLGQSIARATNRKFVRQSLGGVHDEAEIRGHRRTYIGALPGRIIQGIKRAGSKNPVFMLDEVDKLSASFHGDPSAALLEVLDPEQNASFQDHYLDVPFDLSQVFFIATANILDTVPAPLRDRMEIIELPGYAEEDKLKIALRYLVPRQLEASGLRSEQLTFTENALREVIRGYTREAGVRQLERQIAAICRGVATRFAEGFNGNVTIDAGLVLTYLGPAKFFNEVALRTSLPGVATGLAWTPVGGDILFVEATKMAGEGKLILTGQLGDVMKESAQAALSLVKSRAAMIGIDAELFRKNDLHVHIPAGAIPKDGPSAGITIFVALVSLFTGRRVRNDVAMTGEISLRGLVLPVGGIKEKVLAAKRAGISAVLLPEFNQKDLDDVPEPVKKSMRFEFLESVDQALSLALEPDKEQSTEPSRSQPELPSGDSLPPAL